MASTVHRLSRREKQAATKAKAERRKKLKDRLNGNSFSALRHDLANDPMFGGLSGNAIKVFCYFLGKCDGTNNGELVAPQGLVIAFLQISRDTLKKAIKELIDRDLLEITEYSTNHTPTYYGLTCFPMFGESRPSDRWKKQGGDNDGQ